MGVIKCFVQMTYDPNWNKKDSGISTEDPVLRQALGNEEKPKEQVWEQMSLNTMQLRMAKHLIKSRNGIIIAWSQHDFITVKDEPHLFDKLSEVMGT